MQEKLNKLVEISVELGRLYAVNNALRYDVFITNTETMADRIFTIEAQIEKLKNEVTNETA